MKIICIGRNYAAHIEELKNERPTEPVIFTKPDTALLRNNASFYYPNYTKEIHHEVEIVLKICEEGKSVAQEYAHKYYEELALGIDFTARDLQTKAKEKGLPWALAKGFNGSAPISKFVPVSNFSNLQDINFKLDLNGKTVQEGNTSLMLYTFDYIIAYVSQFITLKKGDLIFTGTPAGVGAVAIGDRLQGYIEQELFFDFEVK